MHWWLVHWTGSQKIQFRFLVLPQIHQVPLGESLSFPDASSLMSFLCRQEASLVVLSYLICAQSLLQETQPC